MARILLRLLLLICLNGIRYAEAIIHMEKSVFRVDNEPCHADRDVLTVTGANPIEGIDANCPNTVQPAYQTGQLLVLNSVQGQSGSVLCANSNRDNTEDCDLLQLDVNGVLLTQRLDTPKVSIGAAPGTAVSPALLTLTAPSDSSVDIICVNSPGRNDCNLFRLSGAGVLSLSGQVVADGGFRTSAGDISTGTGAVTAGGSLEVRGAFNAVGSASLSGGLAVKGETSVETLLVSSALSLQSDLSLRVASLNATSANIGALAVDALAVSGPASLAQPLSLAALTVTGALQVDGSTSLASVNASGLLSTGGLAVSGAADLTGDLSVGGALSSASLVVNGVASMGSLALQGTLTLDSLQTQTLSVANITVSGRATLGAVAADSLELAGDAAVHGDLFVDGDTELAALAASADVILLGSVFAETLNATAVTSRTLTVALATTLSGPLDCPAGLSTSSLAVSALLNVTGDSFLDTLTVKGPLAAADLTSSGDVSVLGALSITGSLVADADLQVTGAVSLGELTATNITTNNLTTTELQTVNAAVSGLATIEALLVTDLLEAAGDVSVGGALTVKGEVTARAIIAEQTLVQTSYQVYNVTATHLTTEFLTVTRDASVGGFLSANVSEAADLLVLNALVVEGGSFFDLVNITGALHSEQGLVSAGSISTTGASGIFSSGTLAAAGDLAVAGKGTMSSLAVDGEVAAISLTAADVFTSGLNVTGDASTARITASGLIEALEGLTSPRDIVTTGDGIIATTGVGEIISRGLLTGVAGITSPSFIATSDNGTMYSSGSLTVNASVAIAGNFSLIGSTVLRGPVNVTSLHINSTLNVGGPTTVTALAASGLIAGNAGVAATSLISANLTLNSLVVTGLINASAVAVDTAIWTPAIRYNSQPVLFSGYSDVYSGTGEACSLLC